MEVLVMFRKEMRTAVFASLQKIGFRRLSGYEAGVGEYSHIHGNIPDECFDAIRTIEGIENVENTEDYDSYE
ncbi:hypothetical protein HYV71_02485 [Candidatus Uhrbacteria bacterium]|nr:hypothetical protein [Candidatus Uhrbacteria bacterium]